MLIMDKHTMHTASTSYQWSSLRPPPCHALSGFYLSAAGWIAFGVIPACVAIRLMIWCAEILAQ
jgi:hypothetical protein